MGDMSHIYIDTPAALWLITSYQPELTCYTVKDWCIYSESERWFIFVDTLSAPSTDRDQEFLELLLAFAASPKSHTSFKSKLHVWLYQHLVLTTYHKRTVRLTGTICLT